MAHAMQPSAAGPRLPFRSQPEAPMKRLLVLSCVLAFALAASPASAGRRPKHLSANARPPVDIRALWLQAPGRVDTVFHHDSTRVRRDSALVDSTVRDSLRRPKPTP